MRVTDSPSQAAEFTCPKCGNRKRPEFELCFDCGTDECPACGGRKLKESPICSKCATEAEEPEQVPDEREPRHRTISYLRAIWVNQTVPLQKLLEECLRRVPDDERFDLAGTQAMTLDSRVTTERLYLHVAVWADRQSVSVVVRSPDREGLGEALPGPDWDYLRGDGMLLCSGCHCLVLPSDLAPAAMEDYVRSLLDRAGLLEENPFELQPVADRNVSEIIRREGVKSVDLNLGQFAVTADVDERRARSGFDKLQSDILEFLVPRRADRRAFAERGNVSTRLLVTVDTRKKMGLTAQEFVPIARRIKDESPDDSVDLVTGTGRRIRRGALVTKTQVWLPEVGTTVDHEEAWRAMDRYFDDLAALGTLEH